MEYINAIVSDRLRRAAGDVWLRLPEYARVFLAELAVPIREMTPDELVSLPPDMLGTLRYTPDGDPELEIAIRPVIEDAHLRFALVHEFAHLVLHHHLRGRMAIPIRPEPAQFLAEWEDETATFLHTVEWGFYAEFNSVARTQSGPGPRWLEAYRKEAIYAGRQDMA